MCRITQITKITKQLTFIKVTPVLKKKLEADKTKVIAHTYSGEYFPLYQNEQGKVQSSYEYQAHW